MYFGSSLTSAKGWYNESENYGPYKPEPVNHESPVNVVLFIDKHHPPETNHVWPTDSTSMCKDFSYENTSNEQNSFQRVSLSTKQFTKHNTWIVGAIF